MPLLPARLLVPAVALACLLQSLGAWAIPVFARQYEMSCAACHSAFPRLNAFGEEFAGNNYRLPSWRDKTVDTGDNLLALPEKVPFAVRAQAYFQGREGESIDPLNGKRVEADTDFQAPYLVKLLSSAPLSENLTYYFYAIFAEKGENGEVIIEDAWIRHSDLFSSGVGLQLGQFQISDLMFPREVRLTFQDFMVYRMASITYERGMILDRSFGPVDLALGLVNGNGITDNFNVNSPGYRRPDNLFDDNNSKSAFARLGVDEEPLSAGLFALSGKRDSATGPAGLFRGERDSDVTMLGVDFSGSIGNRAHWYAQYLWTSWDDFLQPEIGDTILWPNRQYDWHGGFLGLDYIASDRWAFSLLYNSADANDLAHTDTIYEGIEIDTLTFTASYYFMRNAKGIIEINADFLGANDQQGLYFTGHLDKESYILLGFDVAY
ncbi:hypothetical protein [Microbulbifer sp. YPW16]|uniref:hypothetical protein n=1 Tax=Microbulbifer sp. YPW16 TaxID=2904242 RepID=UPI001E4AA096|nr:hypothetical protein [Microbulbifer sp. YPW16]UHQ55212.1 hypothetical protein LVE68_17140 [Microbulbifer sp. YPW16]